MRMSSQKKVDAFNSTAKVGTNITYWPKLNMQGLIIHKNGKRTTTRSVAGVHNGDPVVFINGVEEYVHLDHVQIGESIVQEDSPCFDEEFIHLW